MIQVLFRREVTVLLACAIISVTFSFFSPYFLTIDNFGAILRNCYELFLISLGMTLLMAMAGIDISVGALLGLCAILVGKLVMVPGIPIFIVFISGPLLGIFLGLLISIPVVYGKVPAIIATLGFLGIFKTSIYAILGGRWLSGLPKDLTELVYLPVLGFPLILLIIILVFLLTGFLLQGTPYGVQLRAVGNSIHNAKLGGLAVNKIQIFTFILSGAFCGLAGTLFVATYRNVEMSTGNNLALEAIAAVIIGGTKLTGGNYSLIGTILGVFLIKLIQNGLLFLGIASLWQIVVTGVIILIILVLEKLTSQILGKASNAA